MVARETPRRGCLSLVSGIGVTRCHFCLRELVEVGRAVDRHHLVPRRYFRRGEDHRRGNLVKTCTSCHRQFHQEFDDPRYSIREYLDLMDRLDWGRGLFGR